MKPADRTSSSAPLPDPEGEAIRARQKRYLMPGVPVYYGEPVAVSSASGARVVDTAGKEYLDFFAGILTVSVGHANAEVNAAASAQMERFGHTACLYPSEPVVALAEKLAEITPGELEQTYFTTSGTEADETAVMLAQVHTGNTEVLALRHGYSGRSMAAQNLNGLANWRTTSSQVAAVKQVLAPYCYRCPLKMEPKTCGIACARDIEDVIQTSTSGRVAALIAEPIQGVGGFITAPKGYFEIAAEIVRKHGGLFLCDEVQTGFARTGKMFAIEHHGVEPDVLTMAKGIANGFPIAATITRKEIAASLKKLTISTFGGNPVSCAAALATIEVLQRDGLAARAEQLGASLREGLLRLQRRFPSKIGEVRGLGLMLGVEIVRDEQAGDRTPDAPFLNRVFEAAKQRGLLVGKGGLYGNVFRFGPPLVIGEDDVREALQRFESAFAACVDG
jgi:alanine-glyoxylate transaminase/(R)-3-amino-2-methylpropionate-pyruvate transaminase